MGSSLANQSAEGELYAYLLTYLYLLILTYLYLLTYTYLRTSRRRVSCALSCTRSTYLLYLTLLTYLLTSRRRVSCALSCTRLGKGPTKRAAGRSRLTWPSLQVSKSVSEQVSK